MLTLDLVEMRDRMANGALTAEELARACLAQIAAREPEVQAWAWLDEDDVVAQARRLDGLRRSGAALGPLHGLPVGLKDIIDTKGIPTENGTVLDAGRVPEMDAAIVTRLRAAGAVIMGKTVSTELAFLAPSKTHNPANRDHTPGGSSAGSAAAVAAAMVPLAVGTQTGGSVIRPAAYCGVTGFKPSFGMIPRTGILPQSPTLDTVGVFGRSVADVALLAEVLWGYDAGDPATAPMAPPRLLSTALSAPPVMPTLAFVRLPGFAEADEEMRLAMEEIVAVLGDQCFEAPLPNAFDDAAAIRERINFAEMAKAYYHYEKRGWDQLSPQLRGAMEAGKATLARDYLAALDWAAVYRAAFDEILQRCDALLVPAATGPAPKGLESTGNAIFNGVFTLCGMPAVTIPTFRSAKGLPMGVQLVGRRGDDARLLRTANWLAGYLSNLEEQEI